MAWVDKLCPHPPYIETAYIKIRLHPCSASVLAQTTVLKGRFGCRTHIFTANDTNIWTIWRGRDSLILQCNTLTMNSTFWRLTYGTKMVAISKIWFEYIVPWKRPTPPSVANCHLLRQLSRDLNALWTLQSTGAGERDSFLQPRHWLRISKQRLLFFAT